MPESNLPMDDRQKEVPALPQAGNDITFDQVLAELEDIAPEDANYNRAHRALQELMRKLDLTPKERESLEGPIGGLEAMLKKMEAGVIHIAAFGMVGRGKSSLLNALLGRQVFEAGVLHGVTRSYQVAKWEVSRENFGDPDHPVLRATLPGMAKSELQLIDTPGIDEVGGESRELLAKEIAEQSDLLLFVVSGDMTKVEYQALSQLREVGKPMLLVFNKIDQYPEADRDSIYNKICNDRVKELLKPEEIVMASAAPLVPLAKREADGRISVKMQPGLPQVDDLKLKILEVLHREGKSLVALNSMLYADDVNEQITQRKMEIRNQSANQIIWNGVMAKAIAVALNPITVLDIVSSAAVDVSMIVALSRLYGIEMTNRGAMDLLKSVGVAMGGITAGELLADLGLSSLKGLLGVAIMQGAVAGVSSYGLGQVVKTYLANGASWGTDGPKAVVADILQSLDKDSILNRIKTELRSKIDLPSLRTKPPKA
jgi:GTPase